jgi:hypothetical protein
MEDVFELEAKTVVDNNDSYLKAYPHMLSYTRNKTSFDESDLSCSHRSDYVLY